MFLRPTITAFFFLLMALSATRFSLAEDTKPANTPDEKIEVLLIDGQNNHDWKRCSPVMMATLEATGRFKIEQETVSKSQVADFSPDFTKYDVVLSNYNGASDLSP